MVLQHDAENAIRGLAQAIQNHLGASKVSVREAPPYSHQSQGAVESMNAFVQSQIRALWLDTRERYPELDITSNVVPWLIRHAGWLIARFHTRSRDKLTPYKMVTGGDYSHPVARFGEVVLGKIPKPQTKIQRRWVRGVWLGKLDRGVLPGDKMFQAQRLNPRFSRPAILHGYGGAKREIPHTLPSLAKEGWVPLAHALVGYLDKLPLWCQEDLRPVMGTSCDFRIHPDPLTKREQLLLLSLWRRVLPPCLPNQCALRTWLARKKDIPILHGPENPASPHSFDRKVDFEPMFQDLAMQAACNPVDNSVLHPMKAQLVALRIVAYCISLEHLESARTTLFLSDSPVVWVSSFFSVSGDGSGTAVSVAGATGSSFFSSAAGAGATGSVLASAAGGAVDAWPSHCSAWPLPSAGCWAGSGAAASAACSAARHRSSPLAILRAVASADLVPRWLRL